MKTKLTILALLIAFGAAAHAQVEPSATMGPAHLQYVFRYSESAYFDASTGDRQTISPSASISYVNGVERHPFTVKYTGGYTWAIAGSDYATGLFQRMVLSQVLNWRHWSINLNDNVAYLPQSPTTGFSGIPGTGEPIGEPNPNPPTDQTVLSMQTHVISNQATGQVWHSFGRAMSLGGSGGSLILRFPDGNGLNTDSLMAGGSVSEALNSRNRITGNYGFAQYTYPASPVTFESNTLTAGFRRQWTHPLSTTMMVGPEWIASNDSAVVPASTRISANAAIDYQFRFGNAGLNYNHGTGGGAGYYLGASYDTARLNFSRQFVRDLGIGLDASYNRTIGLAHNGVTDALYAGGQASWRFSEHVSTFGSYTAINQRSSSALYGTPFVGIEQVVSFGISYSPRGTRLITH
jgi:hypothetical protein